MVSQIFNKKKATQKSLERQKATRKSKSRVLIATEGSKTEVIYIRALEKKLGLSNLRIEIEGECGTSPLNVVEFAINKINKTKDAFGDYDLVLCVFDKDQHTTYAAALSKIAAANTSHRIKSEFQAIFSIPCFEAWLIFHFSYSRSPILGEKGRTDAQEAVHTLSKIPQMTGYQKSITKKHLSELMERCETAKKNSSLAWDDFLINGGENPTSRMHFLIDHLESLNSKQK